MNKVQKWIFNQNQSSDLMGSLTLSLSLSQKLAIKLEKTEEV